MADQRPDPDALLARIQNEAERAARGRLKLFFGASAGVGKTYAMLSAARRQRDQGVDAVIGVVETHGRSETEALTVGLERIPLREIAYRDRTFAEFDLDAALQRKPALILVDELAHSNVEGSRHPKRWQDVEELLAAGIDVYTTINVQHLETLNDVVSGITGIRVRETVPDRVFDRADEVVLVDLTPDELLQRLKEGKVYISRQAESAVRNFFRKGNLIALRELALRRTADRVDGEMLQYRRDRAVAPVWQTRDSLLACVAAGADDDRVVRTAGRIASRLEIPWHAIYVETPERTRIGGAARQAVMKALKLAQSMGAETATLADHDEVAATVRYARDHNLSRMIVGHSGRLRRWLPRGWFSPAWAARAGLPVWRRSFADRLAGSAPDLEVTIVSAVDPAAAGSRSPAHEDRFPIEAGSLPAYAGAAAVCAGAALVSAPLQSFFTLPNIVMLFLLAVVLVALRFGRGPAVLASFLSVLEFDFFFVPPKFSFAVSDVQYLLTFAVMLAVGLIAGQLTAGLQYQARVANRREGRVRGLYEMARDLSGALLPDQIAEICERFLDRELHAQAILLLADDREKVVLPREDGDRVDPVPLEPGIAQWALDHGEAAGLGTNTLPATPALYLPLKAPMRMRGVLVVRPRDAARLQGPEQSRLLDTVARLAAIALERVHYVEVAQRVSLQMESERLRNSLLSAISHDLRTPLAALVGLADSLQWSGGTPAQQNAIVERMREQTQRMRSLVENLLDMARLQAGQVALNRQWNAIEEVVERALRAMAYALAAHVVRVQLPADLPMLEMDAALMERVFDNLLENAGKFTPPGSVIDIGARAEPERVVLWVEDNGPGVPRGKEEAIFSKFERGHVESATPGVGLGLAICRAIVEAHGGTIRAENRPGGGARFWIELPRGNPPEVPAESVDPQ